MKKYFPVFALILMYVLSFGQVISSNRWSDLFSYNNVLVIREDAGKLIAATENGIFFYTPSSGEITKLSKANGLHEVKISAFDYNPETKTGLVGYANGTLDVITEDGITFVVDIPLATGYTGSKKINHISITENQAVLSVNYGVSIFNLDKKEFGDSAFFLNNGVYEAAKGAVIKDNFVYAATATGIKKHEINVTFPIYSGWSTVQSGNFTQIDIENGVIAFSTATNAFFGNGNSFNNLPQGFTNIQDVTVTSENILITENSNISEFSIAGGFQKKITSSDVLNTSWISNNKIFAGSKLSGILDEENRSWKPDGPYNNQSHKLEIRDDKIWVSSGGREGRYNYPAPNIQRLGFYFFNGTQWVYPSYFKNNSAYFNILDVVANPVDNSEVFFTNYSQRTGQGFYRMKYDDSKADFDLIKYYPTGTTYNRPVGLVFDDKNNLFGSAAFYEQNQESAIYYFDRSSDSFISKGLKVVAAAQKPLYFNGMIWLPTPRANYFAVIQLNNTPQNLGDDPIHILDATNGLPSSGQGTLAIAIDKNEDAWIGSDKGLRILSNAPVEIKDNPKLEPIIITQNGIGEELFRDSAILQIDVDSGNQKWVSVENGGVFYLSPNGQNTIYHFTKENSPLPTNSVTDIKVDQKTGKVYFVTFDGIVVYQGDAVNVSENFGNVLVYPNPVVYANYKGNVNIRGLAERTNIRITDAAGNMVHQAVARGGYYQWDLTNKGKRVASGVYFVLMTNADGTDKATAKIAVVN